MPDRPDWRTGREIREHEIKTTLQQRGMTEREAANVARKTAEKAIQRAIQTHTQKGS